MAEEYQDVTTGGEGVGTAEAATPVDPKEVPPARAALVKEVIEDIKAAKEKHEPAFKRMRDSMKLAANGTTDDARAKALDGAYVVPVINRHINQAVASLYAKNPKAVAKRKDKLLYQIWDGDPASLAAATQTAMVAMQAPPPIPVDQTGQDVGPPMVDPAAMQAQALLMEVAAAKQEMLMYDRMGKTMGLLYAYYLDEQDAGYKEQYKALVRRAKVCGVGWVDLGYQRIMQPDPDATRGLADARDQIAQIEAGLADLAEDKIEENTARMEELKIQIEQLQNAPEIIVREGPVYGFPRATEVIPDCETRHLKTLAGCRRLTREFDMTPQRIKEVYGVDVGKEYTAYSGSGKQASDRSKRKLARVWQVQDKQKNQVYTVCDGYPDFLKEPAEPDVKIERFFTLFPLVFNEIESEDDIFPPSDAWNSRHMQAEINTNRNGLREHRIASRPRPVTAAGRLEKQDETHLGNGEAFEIIKLNSMLPGDRVEDLLQWLKVPGVDPNLYETETAFSLLGRTVGAQAANFGDTSGDTATETSIAEQSRMSVQDSDIDDLDNLLTAIARATGQLMLQELSKDMVIEICGPGAVWPDTPPTREQIAKDLILGIEAGSNGRPNKAAELANFERAMPYVTLLPGVNPKPLAKKAVELMDINVDDAIVEGLPSIQAMNQMAGSMAAGAGPDAPDNQGGKGKDNAEGPNQENEPGSQPAYPDAGQRFDSTGNPGSGVMRFDANGEVVA
jgi:hypothetical protein